MTMLPRLQAEESLADLNLGILSSGHADKKEVTKAVNRLERIIGGGRNKRVQKATPEVLASMGIATVTVAPASPPDKGADNG